MQFSDPGWVSICALFAGVRILSRSQALEETLWVCAGSNLRVVQIRNDGARRIFVLRKRWRGCKLSGGEGWLVQAVNDADHSGSGGRAFSLENEIELQS
jgi:hypothetical protein